MSLMNVLIAGCGYIGTALGSLLAAEGYTVWGLRRHPDTLPPDVHPVAADLTSPETLQALPQADWVFYTAAPDTHDEAAYRAVYVEGVRNLLQALTSQQIHPRRVFLTSSTGVYGESSGAWVDETSSTKPTEFAGMQLLQGERLLLEGPFPAGVLRLGGIYGPGRASLIDRVRRGEIAWSDDEPAVYFNRIHRDDAAGALRHLMMLSDPDPIYLGVDYEPTTMTVLLDWLAEALGVPPTRQSEASKVRTARHPANKRCRNAKLVASGYAFRFPTFREGYAVLLTE
jgi:nucleoside-diphosphate-sugar epimerase